MRVVIFILIFHSLLFSCSTRKKVGVEEDIINNLSFAEVKNAKQLEEAKGKNSIVYGTIIREEFINKGGRSTGYFETLIKIEDGETVHLRNKGENKYDYQELDNKKVKIEAVIFYGNIDSDNPEHQSRVGYRIDYTTITVVD